MWTKSKLDKKVTVRWSKLGQLGEHITCILLKKEGFKNIKNLNDLRKNAPFADVYAEKNGKAYVVSVKMRNKYETSGSLNSRYKLGADCYKKARIVEKEYKAEAAWITIALDIDTKTYDAYFGLLSSLEGNTGVVMTPEATKEYKCLGHCSKLKQIGISESEYITLKNRYERK